MFRRLEFSRWCFIVLEITDGIRGQAERAKKNVWF